MQLPFILHSNSSIGNNFSLLSTSFFLSASLSHFPVHTHTTHRCIYIQIYFLNHLKVSCRHVLLPLKTAVLLPENKDILWGKHCTIMKIKKLVSTQYYSVSFYRSYSNMAIISTVSFILGWWTSNYGFGLWIINHCN